MHLKTTTNAASSPSFVQICLIDRIFRIGWCWIIKGFIYCL